MLRSPTLEQLGDGFHDLVEAFQESNIPILIQAHDWARLPESFHREIERDYVVVQEGAKGQSATADEWQEVKLVRSDWSTIDYASNLRCASSRRFRMDPDGILRLLRTSPR